MAKADLQQAVWYYEAAVQAAQTSALNGQYAVAVREAIRAWQHVEDMLSFKRRYEKAEFDSVPCVDLVLRIAPLIFDSDSLDEMARMLKEKKAVERVTSDNLGERLAEARQQMSLAWHVWSALENKRWVSEDAIKTTLQDAEGDWREILRQFQRMGTVVKHADSGTTSYRLVTDLDELTTAVCPNCGSQQLAPKSNCLRPMPCLSCQADVVRTMTGSISPVEFA